MGLSRSHTPQKVSTQIDFWAEQQVKASLFAGNGTKKVINQNSEVGMGYGKQVIGNSVSMLVEKIFWISQVPCAGEHVSDKIQTVRKKSKGRRNFHKQKGTYLALLIWISNIFPWRSSHQRAHGVRKVSEWSLQLPSPESSPMCLRDTCWHEQVFCFCYHNGVFKCWETDKQDAIGPLVLSTE